MEVNYLGVLLDSDGQSVEYLSADPTLDLEYHSTDPTMAIHGCHLTECAIRRIGMRLVVGRTAKTPLGEILKPISIGITGTMRAT